jgi:hypothetical protein
MTSKDEAMASQLAEGAFGPNGYIQADSLASFTQLRRQKVSNIFLGFSLRSCDARMKDRSKVCVMNDFLDFVILH